MQEVHQQVQEGYRSRLMPGGRPRPDAFECSCPGPCDDLDDRSGKPVHAPECSCGCDVA